MQMCDLRCNLVFQRKPRQEFIDRQNQVGILDHGTGLIEQFETLASAFALQPFFIAGMIDQDPAHRLRRRREEMTATIELLVSDQPQIGFVNQCRGVEGMAGHLRVHPRGGELAKLGVDEREQFNRSLAVTGLGGIEKAGYIGHDGV
jgi:hypothetical protein